MPEARRGYASRGTLYRTVRIKAGANRVYRGGSWNDNARNCRAACRNRNEPDNRNDNLGLRLARVQVR